MARIFGLDIPGGLIEQFYNALTLKPNGEAESVGKRRATVSYATAETIASRSLFRIFEPTWDTFLQPRRDSWAVYWASLPFGDHSGANGWPGSGFSAFTYLNAPRWKAGLPLLLDPPFSHNLVGFVGGGSTLRFCHYDAGVFSSFGSQIFFGVQTSNLAVLDSNTFVVARRSGGDIQAYRNSGGWAALGNPFSPSGNGSNVQIFAMSETRVVIYLSTTRKLEVLDFDGNDWHVFGPGTILPYVGVPFGIQFTPTRIAIGVSTDQILQAYDFNGLTWDPVGEAKSAVISASSRGLGLTSSVAIVGNVFGAGATACRFDGFTWQEIGNPSPSLPFSSHNSCRMSHTTFALIRTTGGARVQIFYFDGSDIIPGAVTTGLGGSVNGCIGALPD